MFTYLSPFDGPVVPGLEEHEIVYAKHQPRYIPLRALPGAAGDSAISRWTFTDEERLAIARGADILLEVTHFRKPLAPVRMILTDQTDENFTRLFAIQMNAPYAFHKPAASQKSPALNEHLPLVIQCPEHRLIFGPPNEENIALWERHLWISHEGATPEESDKGNNVPSPQEAA